MAKAYEAKRYEFTTDWLAHWLAVIMLIAAIVWFSRFVANAAERDWTPAVMYLVGFLVASEGTIRLTRASLVLIVREKRHL